ncbi:hypothetical protein Pfo_028017 [Paulownia fortunei]|nr:hypothetical protein Pfo_028017 [Paulownia fortunei]
MFPAAMPFFLKSLAIPEHEYIWQGSFEICRSGKSFDSWDGIQAHLSRCASPKVIEAVNKFKSRIVLYEVPRVSTWPIQFQEHGVREDNIALFFFAKDLESYDKIYKLLLDNMMKNDLALKGNFNGVELLIFPSNQLPDNSQRWNMLFFLWGPDSGLNSSSSVPVQSDSAKQCQGLSATCLEEASFPASDPSQAASCPESSGREQMLMQLDTPLDRQQFTHHFSNSAALSHDMEGIGDRTILDRRTCNQDLVKSKMDAEDLPINGETFEERPRDQIYKHGAQQMALNAKDCLRPDSCVVPRTLYPGTSPVLPGNDDDTCAEPSGTLEKMNHVATGSSVLENRRREVHYETGIPEYNENAERHFFPMERQPVTSIHLVDRSMPWKMHPVEQNRLHDRAPNLELALGAK